MNNVSFSPIQSDDAFAAGVVAFADELRRIKGDLDRETADLSARYGLG